MKQQKRVSSREEEEEDDTLYKLPFSDGKMNWIDDH